MRLFRAVCIALVLMTVSISTAQAHKPLFKTGDVSLPSRAMVLSDATTSWAIYASLDHPNEADYYAFHVPENGLNLEATLTIPSIESLRNFAPHLALLGPGLPTFATRQAPLAVPAHDGAQLVDAPHAGETERFNEPFTQTAYWNRQSLQEPLRAPGLYYLVVFNRPRDLPPTGKYVLAVGRVERFGLKDLLTFPFTYLRVRWFAEAGLPLWCWIVLILSGALLIGGVVHHRLRIISRRRAC